MFFINHSLYSYLSHKRRRKTVEISVIMVYLFFYVLLHPKTCDCHISYLICFCAFIIVIIIIIFIISRLFLISIVLKFVIVQKVFLYQNVGGITLFSYPCKIYERILSYTKVGKTIYLQGRESNNRFDFSHSLSPRQLIEKVRNSAKIYSQHFDYEAFDRITQSKIWECLNGKLIN